jgi:2-polyprenyl-3-methyl-5-hydroxy-6-metoxy-1,4-benzoquinol methylase
VYKYFDDTAEYWDHIYTGRKFTNWHMAHRRQLVIDAVRRLSNGLPLKVLDLGCGTGVLTRDLVQMGHSVAALDCSQNMVRTLMRYLGGRSEPRFVGAAIGSAGEACFKSGAFDLITCVGVIQYQRNPEVVFEEICRLLKPGGACVFTVPNQLTVHHLLDPWCFVRFIHRTTAIWLRSGESWLESGRAAFDGSAYTDNISKKRYFRRDVPALVKAHPLVIRETIGFGYGPFTVVNKSVLPDRVSIALSTAFTKLSQRRHLSWLSVFANRWVVVLEKPSSRHPA